MRDLHQTRATDGPVSDTLQQPVERLGAMGVDRQHLTGQATATPSRDNNVKRARAMPAVGIYRPPAARRSDEQIVPSPAPRSSSPGAEMKPEQSKPARQRRPDIQVYVPRAKRLSTGGQDRVATSTASTSSSQQSSSPSLRTKGSLNSRTLTAPPQKSNGLLPDEGYKSKSSAAHCHSVPTSVPTSHCCNNKPSFRPDSDETHMEVSDWTKSTRQPAEPNCHLSDLGLGMNDVAELDVVERVMTQQISTKNARSVYREQDRKDLREMERAGIEELGVEREIIRRSSESSSCGSTSGQNGHNTPTFLDTEEEVWDYCNDVKNGVNISKTALLEYGKDMYNSSDSSNNYNESSLQPVDRKQECDTTQLVMRRDSRSVEFPVNFLDDVCVDQGSRRRSSKSSSSDGSTGHSDQNSPSSVTDNGIQAWDYYSEIKNATNSSQAEVLNFKMDTQNSEWNNVTQDSGFLTKSLDVSLNQEESDVTAKSSDYSDQFLDCSDIIHENKLVNGDEQEFGSVNGDTSFSSSVDNIKEIDGSGDQMCSREIFVSDECRSCKKDEDECQMQEEQNRKNRRILRGNFMSDVLIISDPEPLLDTILPSKQVEPSLANTSSPNGLLNKKKKIRHRGENAITQISGSPFKVQSADKQKSSSTSSPLSVSLNPDECTWDMMFDDNGECLDPKLMEELTSSVGSVTIEKPRSDYRSYQSRTELIMSGAADDEFAHVLEIYNFPAEFKTHDLCAVFSPYMKGGFEIKWVDDTHALGVFSSPLVAAEVLASDHPFVKTRPLHQATHDSRMKARRSAESLQPYRARPETCAALARRLVTGALGVRLTTTPEEREAERKILKEAREKRRLAARQRDEAWEGTLGEK